MGSIKEKKNLTAEDKDRLEKFMFADWFTYEDFLEYYGNMRNLKIKILIRPSWRKELKEYGQSRFIFGTRPEIIKMVSDTRFAATIEKKKIRKKVLRGMIRDMQSALKSTKSSSVTKFFAKYKNSKQLESKDGKYRLSLNVAWLEKENRAYTPGMRTYFIEIFKTLELYLNIRKGIVSSAMPLRRAVTSVFEQLVYAAYRLKENYSWVQFNDIIAKCYIDFHTYPLAEQVEMFLTVCESTNVKKYVSDLMANSQNMFFLPAPTEENLKAQLAVSYLAYYTREKLEFQLFDQFVFPGIMRIGAPARRSPLEYSKKMLAILDKMGSK